MFGDYVDTLYDENGRLSRQSRPYRLGDTKQWKETVYDAAGRVSESREPYVDAQDLAYNGSVTRMFYNEASRPAGASSEKGQTTRSVDSWGRWRWSRVDANGRLAEVLEPNPANDTGFRTTYIYNSLGNLVQTVQPDQTLPTPIDQVRRFRYDSMGRLIAQKLAETSATLNDSGSYVGVGGPGAQWSDYFRYDSFRGNLIQRTDARGVKANYWYFDPATHSDPGDASPEPLNRLQAMSYDISGVGAGLTVLPAPTVTYQYRAKQSPSSLVDVTQLKQVVAAGVCTEDFDYETDLESRLHESKLTLAGRSKSMTQTYAYDNLNRLTQITYPEQYHDDVANPLRKVIALSYDEVSREAGLKVNNVDYASQLSYNPASQITSLKVGSGPNQLSENYQYDPKSGLLTNQSLQGNNISKTLAYSYRKDAPCPPGHACPDIYHSTAYTGQVTAVFDDSKYNFYSYDALGRLQHVEQWKGKTFAVVAWTQDYSYDRYGNRTGTTSSGNSGGSDVPRDGFQSVGYDNATNRIVSSGFSYDPAGNQLTNGSGQTMIYDAASRLVQVKDQNNVTSVTYTYGSSNQRLVTQTGTESSTAKTYYVWDGEAIIAEYTEQTSASMPKWSKNYIYLSSRLLATEQPNASGGELVQYHHPDRLGTRLVTNNTDTSSFEQVNLPFGTALVAESTGATNRRFTSYDHSDTTGLDYAVNRHYDSKQGRFTQVDPLGLGASSLADPQSLNMYSYVGNDPMNRVDPNGQFWGALFQIIGGLFHSFKPNIINGSFAYKNRGPIWVSSTTDFHNISAGYGGIGIPLRTGNQWLPGLLSAVREQTSLDLADIARSAFGKNPGLLEEIEKNIRSGFSLFGLDIHIVACQAAKESAFAKLAHVRPPYKGEYRSDQLGAKGEIGLLQIMPATGRQYGANPEALRNVATNVRISTTYLTRIQTHFGVDIRAALAIYNWGWGNFNDVDRDVNRIAPNSLLYADKILECSRQLVLPGDPYRWH